MDAILLLQFSKCCLRRSRQDNHRRDISRYQPLDGFVVVIVRALHGDIERIENRVGGDFGLAVLQVEVDLFAAQVVIGLDLVSCDDLKLRIIELGDILNTLLDVGVQHRILLLQQTKIVLIDDAHVDALEEEHIIHVLKTADAQNRQNADPVRAQIVDDVADVLGEPRTCAGNAGHHDADGDIVGLTLLVLVAQRLLALSHRRVLVFGQCRTQGGR